MLQHESLSSEQQVTYSLLLEDAEFNLAFYPRDAMLVWVFARATCLFVRRTPVLCQNENDFFTVL